ncbi:hypothetical protein M427DRAFT_444304 [Gonapodya prolifera JEL478]|uniref:Uncharacterized protein n=1 Tax=Gonapodya prolifera (strain JEL478) TaxID=1344416 RepID=A0A139A3C0_GONPJ|nr:hypothetical protein M427DRAFT_444304 [Gonapodya prolifera JEL478]|eukprot:KXS11214.1 hypothetical protein M427DRAFT_444304 [Gonapodya prolifera JEL478]
MEGFLIVGSLGAENSTEGAPCLRQSLQGNRRNRLPQPLQTNATFPVIPLAALRFSVDVGPARTLCRPFKRRQSGKHLTPNAGPAPIGSSPCVLKHVLQHPFPGWQPSWCPTLRDMNMSAECTVSGQQHPPIRKAEVESVSVRRLDLFSQYPEDHHPRP